jgi:phospholipase/carboxylesterase
MLSEEAWRQGLLRARPGRKIQVGELGSGTSPLCLGQARDGLLYVPTSLQLEQEIPVMVMLHGAGGTASQAASLVTDHAERHGLLVLAPDSRGKTWDVIRGGYGPDVEFIDKALVQVFGAFDVDAGRIAIGGFSDGASYALSLGIINGVLFSDILAFSPGFAAPTQATDSPRIFISHGTEDRVLPIDRCSRRLAPALRGSGFDLDYREFPGGHVVPVAMMDAAIKRFLGTAVVEADL